MASNPAVTEKQPALTLDQILDSNPDVDMGDQEDAPHNDEEQVDVTLEARDGYCIECEGELFDFFLYGIRRLISPCLAHFSRPAS